MREANIQLLHMNLKYLERFEEQIKEQNDIKRV